MNHKITPEARDRCQRKSLQEQLEDARREMQRESGRDDMREIEEHLKEDECNSH